MPNCPNAVNMPSRRPLRLVLAPLRGVTQLTFRKCLMKHFGGFTDAVSPFLTTVAGSRIKPTHLADILPAANAFLPIVPQIIGKDPSQFRTLLLAIRDWGYTRCDLNAGCPWPLIVKKGRGAGLLKDADNLRRMLDVGCEVMPNGISVKVRLGVDHAGLLQERMEIFNSYPLVELTIHARTAAQRYEGEVDLDSFAECAALSKAPVIYNGDIRTVDDFKRISSRFPDVAGYMIGRGAIVDPTIALAISGGDMSNIGSRIRNFVLDYSAQTRDELFGPGSFLGRMKEFWSYHHKLYANPDDLWHRIRVCRSYADYDAVISDLSL